MKKAFWILATLLTLAACNNDKYDSMYINNFSSQKSQSHYLYSFGAISDIHLNNDIDSMSYCKNDFIRAMTYMTTVKNTDFTCICGDLTFYGWKGTMIQSANNDIVSRAAEAALLWLKSGNEKYARMATDVFDTYMTGIYYRNRPVDINFGHQQTLVGMQSFEVIHENIINPLTRCYDYLFNYLQKNKTDKMDIYQAAFKKWADIIIEGGVPHNNWDIIQARFIYDIAVVLEDNSRYADGKGRQYYIDYILNKNSIRQWSILKLADYGFDHHTDIWCESPGYSMTVVNEYTDLADYMSKTINYDLISDLPVLPKAAEATCQYLFPSGKICGFGDTHPGRINTNILKSLVYNGKKYNKADLQRHFSEILKLFSPDDNELKGSNVKPAKIEDLVSPTFYSPNVSWLVQRNGMNPQNSLMISENASEGNHQHANGISIELYGKGFTLGPDAGIGKSLYSGTDYFEYYSQFPAHNTVCVDGISSYPVMKSNHAFKLLDSYPDATDSVRRLSSTDYIKGVTYSDVSFIEPESQSNQRRLLSIIDNTDSTGYYVDIFRSRKIGGGDKMHDYFYHNLGQSMQLTKNDGSSLNLNSDNELAFAGAHIYSYSYFSNQQSSLTNSDVKAVWTIHPDKGGDDIQMTMWQQGSDNRKIIKALAPANDGLSRDKEYPYNIEKTPTQTFIARQYGEAWTHPFVSVFEPTTKSQPSQISSVGYFTPAKDVVGIKVSNKSGRTDYIFSSASSVDVNYNGIKLNASYAVIGGNAKDKIILMAKGTYLITSEVSIRSEEPVTVALRQTNGKWTHTSTGKADIRIKGKALK